MVEPKQIIIQSRVPGQRYGPDIDQRNRPAEIRRKVEPSEVFQEKWHSGVGSR